MVKRVEDIKLLVENIIVLNSIIRDFEGKPKRGVLWRLFYRLPKNQYAKITRKIRVKALIQMVYEVQRARLRACPEVLLGAGEALLGAGKILYASECFNRVIEILDCNNQDIRIPALMGRLECAITSVGGSDHIADYSDYLYIVRDLDSVSEKVQKNIKMRLSKADIQLGMIAILNDADDFKKALTSIE